MLTLRDADADAGTESPSVALSVDRPVGLVLCCPFDAGASLVLAAGDSHATLLSVKEGADGLTLEPVPERPLPHEGAVDAAAWGRVKGQLSLATVGPRGAVLHAFRGDGESEVTRVDALPAAALARVHDACLAQNMLAVTGDDCRCHVVSLDAAAAAQARRSLVLGSAGVAVRAHALEPHHLMIAEEARLHFFDLRAPAERAALSRELPASLGGGGHESSALRDADWSPADSNVVGGVLSSGRWVAWDLRQRGEVQGGDAHAEGGTCFRWAPTGRAFASAGLMGDVAAHAVAPGSVAGGLGEYSRWMVSNQALQHGLPTRTSSLSWGHAATAAPTLVGACATKVCVWSLSGRAGVSAMVA